jgi:RNA polymerase sigma-70 factor (ECF subfamily)
LSSTYTYQEPALVDALKQRDDRAFGYLYDHYSGALYSIILQIVQTKEPAADILQEVFVSIWKKIDSYDPSRGRLFTWMLNIARNASIDHIRSRAFQNRRKNQPFPENVNTFGSTATQTNVDSIGLRKTLEKLGPEHRVLIELAYFKGFTHEEIAEMEDIPLGTVKTRIRNALLHLRQFLK